MFQKKEVIYSETIGVCVVDDIVKLADSRKDTYNYYRSEEHTSELQSH